MVQVASAGAPEQVKLTCWLNPFAGVIVIPDVMEPLPLTAPLVGDKLMLKSAGAAVIVRVTAEDVEGALPLSPPYAAVTE